MKESTQKGWNIDNTKVVAEEENVTFSKMNCMVYH